MDKARRDHRAEGGQALVGVLDATLRAGSDDATLAPEELPASAPRDEVAQLPLVDPRRFRITGEVAQGGIGRIFRARDEQLGRPVALKELLDGAGAVAEERFVREALLTARLQHPSIVPIYEAGRWPTGAPFYSMKYVSGRSLADVIADVTQRTSSLEARLGLLPHVLAAAEAIAYAHNERIIHRDLKPANILVGAFGETVVIDWGLAKDLDELRDEGAAPGARGGAGVGESGERAAARGDTPRPPVEALTVLGAVLGTPAYMPPEQATGARVDERADVYALGAILYHLLAGTCPYDGDTAAGILGKVVTGPPPPLEQRQRGIPQDLLAIVHKAMSRDAAARYASAEEFADDLRRFLTGQIVGAHRYSPLELLRRFARRYRAALAVAATALVVLSALLVVGWERNVAQRKLAEANEAAARAAEREVVARADELTLAQAREAAPRDPNEAVACLKTLSPSFTRWSEARLIAADAVAHGVATVLRGHAALVNDVAFSPDGKLLATTSDDRVARLWDVATGDGRELRGHTDEAWMCAFSLDGKLLATSSKDKSIRLWDVETGEVRRTLLGHTGPVAQLLFIRQDTLASSSDDHAIRLWDLRTGEGRLLVEESLMNGAPLSRNGRRLALSGLDDSLRIYDIERGALWSSGRTGSPIFSAALSPDGEIAWSRGQDGSVRRWNLSSGKSEPLLEAAPSRQLSLPQFKTLALSPDGKRLATAGDGRAVRVFDLTTGASRTLIGHEGPTSAVAFSPDGKQLASGGFDGTVRLWDLEGGGSRAFRGFKANVTAVVFSPDGRQLAAASADHTVRLFPMARALSESFTDGGSPLLCVARSPSGGGLAVGGADGSIRLWDLSSGARTSWKGHDGAVRQVVFSPSGGHVATLGDDHAACVWDLGGRLLFSLPAELKSFFGWWSTLAFSPDGRHLAVPRAGGGVELVDVASGARRALHGDAGAVVALAFSGDGELLASGSQAGTVRVVRVEDGATRELRGHELGVASLAFSPDGKTLASGGLDHVLCLWDLTTDRCRKVDASGGGVVQLAFSPDGKLIATLGVLESGVRLFSVGTGLERAMLRGHSGPLRQFSLSREGNRLATAADDGLVRIWDLRSRKSRLLQGHTGKVTGLAFSPDGKELTTVGEDQTIRFWPDALPVDESELRTWIQTATPDTLDMYVEPTAPLVDVQ